MLVKTHHVTDCRQQAAQLPRPVPRSGAITAAAAAATRLNRRMEAENVSEQRGGGVFEPPEHAVTQLEALASR